MLTGGGANLEGMAEIAEQIFDLPVRRGSPAGVGGLVDMSAARVRHRRRAGAVRAPEPRTAEPGRRRRSAFGARLRPAAGHVPRTSLITVRAADEAERRRRGIHDRRHATDHEHETHRRIEPLRLKLDEARRDGARIKVIGVGGGGGNAVNRMMRTGLQRRRVHRRQHRPAGARQQRRADQDPDRRQLTKGLGAGADPDIGRQAALEDTDKLIEVLSGADMVFVTAGLGGGTGTGAAPVIAGLAAELGALTVAVVTKPFEFEGRRRAQPGRARPRASCATRSTP